MEHLEKIEQYIAGSLKGKDLTAFEKLLASDPKLKDEVKAFENIFAGIRRAGEDEFVEKVNTWEKEARSSSQNLSAKIIRFEAKRKWMYVAVAAAISLLVLWRFFPIQDQQKLSGQELYALAFESYPDFVSQMDSGNKEADTLKMAMGAYGKGDYEKAQKLLAPFVVDPSQSNTDLYIYYGISLMETGKFPEAKQALEEAGSAENSNYHVLADWYTALLFLKQDKLVDAKKLLKELSGQEGVYGQKAKDVLKKM